MRLPNFEDAVRAAQAAPTSSAAVVAQAAADPGAGRRTAIDEQRRQLNARRERLGLSGGAWKRPRTTERRPGGPATPAAENRADWPTRACTNCREVPALDEQRRAGGRAGQHRAGPTRPTRAPGGAARAAGEGADRGKLKPWLARHGPGRPGRRLDPGAHRDRLGDGAGPRCASASTRCRSRPAGHRCAPSPTRPAAKLAFCAAAALAITTTTLPRLAGACCAWATTRA